MRKIFFFVLFLFFINIFSANKNLDASYNDGVNTAKSFVDKEGNAIKNFNPNEIFINYEKFPKEKNFYRNVTSQDTIDLINAGKIELKEGEVGKALTKSINARLKFSKSPKSFAMTRARYIFENAKNIIGSNGKNCQKIPNCKNDNIIKECNENIRFLERFFLKKPYVFIDEEVVREEKNYSGFLTTQNNLSGSITLPSSGRIKDIRIFLHPKNISECKKTYSGYLNSVFIDKHEPSSAIRKVYIVFHNKNLNLNVIATRPLLFNFYGQNVRPWIKATYALTLEEERIEKKPRVEWREDGHLDSASACSEIKSECIEPSATKYFGDIPVTLDCWRYKIIKKCTAKSDNNCLALREEGCTEFDVKCRIKLDEICLVQDVKLICPKQKCDDFTVICSDEDSFCLKGECLLQQKTADIDIAKSIAALSGISDASKQFDSKSLSIFKGVGHKCSRDSLDFANCCSNEGWGKDLNLASCSDEEKRLGVAKKNDFAAYVGTYSVDHVLWKERKESYCVFPSKLASLLQIQGRKQLNLDFGDAKNPDCRGFTPEELQKIDFSKIDFSPFYQDIKNKTKIVSPTLIEEKIKNNIDFIYQGKRQE